MNYDIHKKTSFCLFVCLKLKSLNFEQVDFVLKHYKDLSPFLKKCKKLRLSPDFLIPQDMGEDEITNGTPRSTIADGDEPIISWSSGSSGSDNMSMAYSCDEIVRKKRNGLYDQDMASRIMNRRKGIPHRSPLC